MQEYITKAGLLRLQGNTFSYMRWSLLVMISVVSSGQLYAGEGHRTVWQWWHVRDYYESWIEFIHASNREFHCIENRMRGLVVNNNARVPKYGRIAVSVGN